MSNLKIKDWAIDDRPREKMLLKGSESLSDAELIAILIGSGTKEESAVELAKKIMINADNNLNKLGKLTINELCKIKGIGETRAITILSAMELGRRRKMAEILESETITSSKDIFLLFQPTLSDIPYEEFWILLLNRSNKIIDKKKISQGGISGTVTDIKMILKLAIDKLSSSIILCHNHPSGNNKPSEQDISITKKIKESAKLMDINLLDHIIICEKRYFSFADEGLI